MDEQLNSRKIFFWRKFLKVATLDSEFRNSRVLYVSLNWYGRGYFDAVGAIITAPHGARAFGRERRDVSKGTDNPTFSNPAQGLIRGGLEFFRR